MMEWFDLWRHGGPDFRYFLRDLVPLLAFGCAGAVIGGGAGRRPRPHAGAWTGSMKRKEDEALSLGRFSEPALMILISLADGPKHGYAMTDDIAGLTGKRPGPGPLYGAITRLEERGLIERLDSEDRRNPYRLTGRGVTVLRARLAAIETASARAASPRARLTQTCFGQTVSSALRVFFQPPGTCARRRG